MSSYDCSTIINTNNSKDLLHNNTTITINDISTLPTIIDHIVLVVQQIDHKNLKYSSYISDTFLQLSKSAIDAKTDEPDKTSEMQDLYSIYISRYINNHKLYILDSLLDISNNKSYTKYLQPISNELDILKQNKLIKKLYIEHNINECHDLSKVSNLNGIVMLNLSEYLSTILKTYNTDQNIAKQFLVDLPRQDVYVNGVRIHDFAQLVSLVKIFRRKVNLGFKPMKSINSILLLLVLACQSSLCTAFEFLSHKIMNYRNDKNNNMHLVDSKYRSTLRLLINHTDIKCSFEKIHNIIDIMTEDILHIMKVETLIDITLSRGVIVYEQVNK